MENILKVYKEKLANEIAKKKAEVKTAIDINAALDKVRDELSNSGRNLLSMLFTELKGYIEKNKPEFIQNNKDKWENMLERAKALTEYGLYVAPVDLLKDKENLAPVYVGVGAFAATTLTSKLLTKKFRPITAALASVIGGAAYYILYGKDESKERELLSQYIDDANDWIKTALDNMYKIFKDALA
ncbi:hypothetical protein [Hippea maritima]|uniref:Uncharacterized protein n=1 Tax=Hippea maritima (strain ATCC 700847 / DSM 10411 / MH2) TaxID=760142 RepID=F2LY15_HIPMA|nr:hypothetical protein [Hippea maritima]AEA33280.1 hypothetical protein Hipma_0303 [Hippea maritima DSM 10411]